MNLRRICGEAFPANSAALCAAIILLYGRSVMKTKFIIQIFLSATLLAGCSSSSEDSAASSTSSNSSAETETSWARTVTATTETSGSQSYGVSVDSNGNIFAVGSIYGNTPYTFGDGVTATGSNTGINGILLKYNNSGQAILAKTAVSGASEFKAVAIATDGSIYVVGRHIGSATVTYGTGVTAAGSHSGNNSVVIKYDSGGVAQWARSVTGGGNQSIFQGVAVDATGNIYAVGYQFGTGTFTYGTGVSAAGGHTALNAVIVKYDASGTALWAKSVTTGGNESEFKGVATDTSGNVYAVGLQKGTGTYTYDTGVTATGSYTPTANATLIKYDTAGTAIFARTSVSGSLPSEFRAIAVDSSGNAYCAGVVTGTATLTFGTGVSIAGATASNYSPALVKYDSTGTASWAKTLVSGTASSEFRGIAVLSTGNIIVAGQQNGTGTFDYGGGNTATASVNVNNALLVKYSSAGTTLKAYIPNLAPNATYYYAVAAGKSGQAFAVGSQQGTSTYTYDTGASATGPVNTAMLVTTKYGQP
jgi:hypothetical protein